MEVNGRNRIDLVILEKSSTRYKIGMGHKIVVENKNLKYFGCCFCMIMIKTSRKSKEV